MLDKEYIAAIIIFICCTKYSIATKCNKNIPCKFGGKCFGGRCVCGASCRDKGLNLLCGEDENHYTNYCFLKMRSCELQREVKIRCVGSCSSCLSEELPASSLSSQGQILFINSGTLICDVEDEYCFNFGLCVTNYGVKTCICPRGYEGERCERKEHRPRSLKSRPLRDKSGVAVNDRPMLIDTSFMMKLVLCVMSMMGFGIILSSLYYRSKQRGLLSAKERMKTPPETRVAIFNPVSKADEFKHGCSRDSTLATVDLVNTGGNNNEKENKGRHGQFNPFSKYYKHIT